jgi:hypothetical protein
MEAIERMSAQDYAPRQGLKFVDVFNLHSLYEGLAYRSNLVLVGPKGIGKAQPLDAKVLTPSGWVRMGDLKPGDAVIGANGKPTRVTGVFPQGKKKVYRVEMNDGGSTECCMEHLWATQTVFDLSNGYKRWKVRSLEEIQKTLVAFRGRPGSKMERDYPNHRVPVVSPVVFGSKTKLPLAPYLMGALLGDGSLSRLTNVALHKPERDLLQRARLLLPKEDVGVIADDGRYLRIKRKNKKLGTHGKGSKTKEVLEELGLLGTHSLTKFIPEMYLRASIKDRLELLRGLADTDGSVAAQRIDFSTSSPALRDGIVELARSLGGLVSFRGRVTFYTYKGKKKQGAPSYRVSLFFSNGLCPVASKKNLRKWRAKQTPYYRSIVSVQEAGEKECQCIAVDAKDHLYVTDDFIVTHNTLSFQTFAAKTETPIITFDCSEDVRRSHLIGHHILRGGETPFILGPLTTAFEIANEVGRCILVLEEINGLSPQMQKVLNALADFRRRIEVPECQKVFKLKEGKRLWFAGTMNTAVYGGVYALNEDLKSRFRLLALDYPRPSEEKEILNGVLTPEVIGKVDPKLIDRVIQLAIETRQKALEYALSPRDVQQLIEDIAVIGLNKALRVLIGKFDGDDRETIKERLKSIFGIAVTEGAIT